MSITAGTCLGPYEILAPIGAGGMGQVYKARDTRLARDVAIKVSAEQFSERFECEARAIAALNHPNVCHLYDVGPNYLVMELVEGPTLAERLKQGAIPFDESLGITRQIADALDAAHEKAITHRDLKPGNVKIRPDGMVKVLDFGLAKMGREGVASGSGAGSNPADPPTLSMAATQAGMILGTAAYMSPEQARGKPVDKRADIWAFGVVLYEMLTGKRLFEGETISDTLAHVLTKEPDLGEVPAQARRLVERCLEKDPKRRLRDIGDAMLLLEGAPADASPAARSKLPWLIAGAAVLAAVLLALGLVYFRGASPPQRNARFEVSPPGKSTLAFFELSPDGRYLAVSARESGRTALWLRPLDSLVFQALPGTEDATYPFWSPDRAFIGFFAQGKLKKIAIAGGPPQTLCDAPDGRGGTWSRDGVIVFAPGLGSALSRVPATGGVPALVTKLAGSRDFHRFPIFLPDGRRFLYLVNGEKPETNGIYAGSLDGTPSVRILPDESSAAYVPPDASGKSGHLLFRREGTLMAQPFDPGRLGMTGEMFPLAEQVGTLANTNHGAFSVSENGVLGYVTGGFGFTQSREVVWLDRMGKRLGAIGSSGSIGTVKLSPDEKRILFGIATPGGVASDLWLHDTARGVRSRFTFRPGTSGSGIWSPDGSRIVFESDDGRSLYEKAANGAGSEQLLLHTGINTRALDWSRDGKFIVYQQEDIKTGRDLWLLPMEGDRKPIPYLQTPFIEASAQFSPDGRWMAYASNESGLPQVYVQAIPASGAKWQISTAGGDQPRWRGDGKELFYISGDQKLMAVPVKAGAGFETGPPQPLFEIDPISPLLGFFAYQPAADGQRFLVNTTAGENTRLAIDVVLNWQPALKK